MSGSKMEFIAHCHTAIFSGLIIIFLDGGDGGGTHLNLWVKLTDDFSLSFIKAFYKSGLSDYWLACMPW